MNTPAFLAAYSETRNGTDSFTRHVLGRKLVYSDGVRECAEAGCYWLLDIAATELVRPMLAAPPGSLGVLTVRADDGGASLDLSLADGAPSAWHRDIEFTDMPPGEWQFWMQSDDGCSVTMIVAGKAPAR
jgi:hypothetical protein